MCWNKIMWNLMNWIKKQEHGNKKKIWDWLQPVVSIYSSNLFRSFRFTFQDRRCNEIWVRFWCAVPGMVDSTIKSNSDSTFDWFELLRHLSLGATEIFVNQNQPTHLQLWKNLLFQFSSILVNYTFSFFLLVRTYN